jgi:hypothetical protein
MAKGVVQYIGPDSGMVAVKTQGNDFTIIETTNDDFEIGDVVQWESDLYLGPCTCQNVTRRRNMHVIMQNHAVPMEALKDHL